MKLFMPMQYDTLFWRQFSSVLDLKLMPQEQLQQFNVNNSPEAGLLRKMISLVLEFVSDVTNTYFFLNPGDSRAFLSWRLYLLNGFCRFRATTVFSNVTSVTLCCNGSIPGHGFLSLKWILRDELKSRPPHFLIFAIWLHKLFLISDVVPHILRWTAKCYRLILRDCWFCPGNAL